MSHCGFRAATLFSKNCQVLYLKIELESKELNCVKVKTKEIKTHREKSQAGLRKATLKMQRKAAQNKPFWKAYLGIGRAPANGSET